MTEIQDNKTLEDDPIETVKTQFVKIPSGLKPSVIPMFFFFQPKDKNNHLSFKFNLSKKIKTQIRDFLIQVDPHESDINGYKCHFEYYDCTHQWVVINLHTRLEDFDNDDKYHKIRLRYH